MKKGRPKSGYQTHLESPASEAVHFRLCHVCLHLNESSSEISRCEKCSRFLSMEGQVGPVRAGKGRTWSRAADDDEADEDKRQDPSRDSRVVTGLTVRW